ncbi:MAG TPA: hypothetical protein VEI94_14555 [Candidatus Bathyarchaeia archaeon]|nr:hypothetical protein [Candidatus Bathyarchaeia archaeon]
MLEQQQQARRAGGRQSLVYEALPSDSNDRVITNPAAYRRLSEEERWSRLERMSPEESIALGEALLTSELMDLAVPVDDDQPRSLAIALGLPPPTRSS